MTGMSKEKITERTGRIVRAVWASNEDEQS